MRVAVAKKAAIISPIEYTVVNFSEVWGLRFPVPFLKLNGDETGYIPDTFLDLPT